MYYVVTYISIYSVEIYFFGNLIVENCELNPDSMHGRIKGFISDCMTLFNHHTEKKTGIADLYKEVKVKAFSEVKKNKVLKINLERLPRAKTYNMKSLFSFLIQ